MIPKYYSDFFILKRGRIQKAEKHKGMSIYCKLLEGKKDLLVMEYFNCKEVSWEELDHRRQ